MAFDTVIDKSRLEAAMTATADAIREKTGDTADCEWLSDTGFAKLIAAIEAGGGSTGVAGLTKASGSFKPTSTVSSYAVEHDLGVVPKYVYIKWASNVRPTSVATSPLLVAVLTPELSFGVAAYYQSSGNITYAYVKYSDLGLTLGSVTNITATSTEITFNSGSGRFSSSYTWSWAAWG